MEPESRVLTAAEMVRWMILAIVLGLGIAGYFIYGHLATPFHPAQGLPGIEGHR